jgi:5-oxoprolinase (ATP-hydrolysing)
MILEPQNGDYAAEFVREHQREFSFTLPNRKILVENLRVRGRANAGLKSTKPKSISSEMSFLQETTAAKTHKSLKVYFEDGWTDAPLHLLQECLPGNILHGPAMIYDETQMIVVQPRASARILQSHVIIDLPSDESGEPKVETESASITEDPIQLSVMSNRFMGIAEQMGLTLQKTSVSVNIKERLDFSCALFGVSVSTNGKSYEYVLMLHSLMEGCSLMRLMFLFIWVVWSMQFAISINFTLETYDLGTSYFRIRKSLRINRHSV